MDKIFLNEDGSLNLERINSLPYLEYTDVINTMTQRQYDEYINEYISRYPINECKTSVRVIKVNAARGVSAAEFLKKMREKYISNQ